MRPHLASYPWSGHARALAGVPGTRRRAAGPAATDVSGTDLDLRRFFGQKEALSKELIGYDLFRVMGGNAFTLRRTMKQSGFDAVISGMLDRDGIVYVGVSADAAEPGPPLDGYEIVDDSGELPGYCQDDPVCGGPKHIDFAIIPHYRSTCRETADAERCARRRLPFRALRDGGAIVWTGARTGAAAEVRRIA